eukprot:COSAG05_NODE_385_length_10486_cov_12.944835_8_plen_67_part_00
MNAADRALWVQQQEEAARSGNLDFEGMQTARSLPTLLKYRLVGRAACGHLTGKCLYVFFICVRQMT